MTTIWNFIHTHLKQQTAVILLVVTESQGSSPGRQGFMMAIADNLEFEGSIGGGIMEIKLVEKAKSLLKKGIETPEIMFQYHDKTHTSNQSGMICSGHQVIAFVPLNTGKLEFIHGIVMGKIHTISINMDGIFDGSQNSNGFKYHTEREWTYTQTIDSKSIIHIIGGGHVGLALSEAMKFLGFYVIVYDDRHELQTLGINHFADKISIVPNYSQLGEYISEGQNEYAVVMTVGYRTDKQVIKQLIDKSFKYLGLLGSDAKIKSLLYELEQEGIARDKIVKIKTPVGLNINSKTPQEIAISIAAEIILEKNKSFPSARYSEETREFKN
jgi:xanthine dehydrogenase accessory factor